MINIKRPQEYHEGDMADELVEHGLCVMSHTELYDWAFKAYEQEVKSWPASTIRDRYNDLMGS